MAALALFTAVLGYEGRAVINVFFEDFEFLGESHVANRALEVSEHRLKENVLFLNHILLVKESLHSLMIALLGEKCKVLKLLLVLSVVQNSLRKHDVLIDLIIQGGECRPLGRVDLHDIKH